MILALAGPASGWIALALVPLTAAAGWLLRRLRAGSFVRRMRPHYVLGYLALAFAFVHLWFSMGGMAGADSLGIWLATFALVALGCQAIVGSNLQSPGDYRRPLRRWHIGIFASVLVLALGHVLLNR